MVSDAAVPDWLVRQPLVPFRGQVLEPGVCPAAARLLPPQVAVAALLAVGFPVAAWADRALPPRRWSHPLRSQVQQAPHSSGRWANRWFWAMRRWRPQSRPDAKTPML